MVCIQVNCINCNKTFWSKAVKNKMGEATALRNLCKKCENRLRHIEQKRQNWNRQTVKEDKIK